MSSSSWSDLPIDLLVSIRNKLQPYKRFDLTSFRSVCSQWRSIIPAPNPCPQYEIRFRKRDKIIEFIIDNNTNIDSTYSISLPLPSSSPTSFLCSSNGWLVFMTRKKNNEILHLFNPVSNHNLIFPPLSSKLLRHYNKFKPTDPNTSHLHLSKVIVSSSTSSDIAVGGIVLITNQKELVGGDTRFVFCRHGGNQRWNLLMEESKGIRDLALAGDGRFYVIGEDWELYMLDERPSLIRLKRLKLWVPKHIFEPDPEYDPIDERLSICCCGMEESGESDLKVYGCCGRFRFGGSWITLKLEVAKLCRSSNNVNVACEAEWCHLNPTPYDASQYFTPSLRELPLKAEEHNKE